MSDVVKHGSAGDRIRISEEVVATIAGIAASEVQNLASMSGGIVDGIAGILGRKNLGKGIKVDISDNNVVIEMSLIMQYGCKIHEVSIQIQERVRGAVESMTGMKVTSVNINVLGVSTGKEALKIEMVEDNTST